MQYSSMSKSEVPAPTSTMTANSPPELPPAPVTCIAIGSTMKPAETRTRATPYVPLTDRRERLRRHPSRASATTSPTPSAAAWPSLKSTRPTTMLSMHP